MPDWLTPVDGGVVIALHVQPRASKNEIVGAQGDSLKVRLTSPPVEGAANKLCCEFFAKLCGIPKRDVSVLGGEKSRHKRLLISGVQAVDVEDAVAAKMK